MFCMDPRPEEFKWTGSCAPSAESSNASWRVELLVDAPRFDPKPASEWPPSWPALRARLWPCLCGGAGGGHGDHISPLGADRRGSRSGLRGRVVGVPRRSCRRAPLLPRHQLGSGSGALVGAVRRLGRRSWHLGWDCLRDARRALGAPSPPRRHPSFPGRCRTGAAGRPGDRADRQLLQPGAVRRADRRCPGRSRSPRLIVRWATSSSRPFIPPSSTRSSGTSPLPRCSSGSVATDEFELPDCSRSMSRATRSAGSARSSCGSTPPITSSGCGSTSTWPRSCSSAG